MERQCSNCKWYTEGVTNEQRHKWDWSNLGRWATGCCNLYFPRGYVARKPPHPTMHNSRCFQFEPRSNQLGMWIERDEYVPGLGVARHFYCSECGCDTTTQWEQCPKCGAEMTTKGERQ